VSNTDFREGNTVTIDEDGVVQPEVIEEQTQGQDVALYPKMRLPFDPAVQEKYGIDWDRWRTLIDAIFPSAKTVAAVVMALDYCKARDLDIFKRPVHIVPMWSSVLQREIETVWPSISELRTTAFRTKQYGGMAEPEFGPLHKKEFKDSKGAITVEFPEWCRITVTRFLNGVPCTFVGPKTVWLEAYATKGRYSEAPNHIWEGRPIGQIEKCFSADTEVLTEDGFQLFSEATSRIMQVTDAGIEPTDAKPFRREWWGPMIVADGDALNFAVTKNHDMVTDAGKIEAGKLYEITKSNPDYRIPLVVDGTGSDCGIDKRKLVLAAAIVCDGWRKDKSWCISVSRRRKVTLLESLTMHRSRHVQRPGAPGTIAGREIATLSDKDVFVYDELPGIVSVSKLIDRDLIAMLSAEEAAIVVDAMIEFDGHMMSNGTRRFYNSRLDLIAQFERLAVQAGYCVSRRRSRKSEGCRENFYVTLSRKRSVVALSVAGKMTPRAGHRNIMRLESENPSGEVWCCTVPSGVIVVRRGGLSMICGNCAEAAALRRAFPEEIGNDYAAEEMEGRILGAIDSIKLRHEDGEPTINALAVREARPEPRKRGAGKRKNGADETDADVQAAIDAKVEPSIAKATGQPTQPAALETHQEKPQAQEAAPATSKQAEQMPPLEEAPAESVSRETAPADEIAADDAPFDDPIVEQPPTLRDVFKAAIEVCGSVAAIVECGKAWRDRRQVLLQSKDPADQEMADQMLNDYKTRRDQLQTHEAALLAQSQKSINEAGLAPTAPAQAGASGAPTTTSEAPGASEQINPGWPAPLEEIIASVGNPEVRKFAIYIWGGADPKEANARYLEVTATPKYHAIKTSAERIALAKTNTAAQNRPK
jgi:hypothetical protein